MAERLANLKLLPKTISIGGVSVEITESKSKYIPVPTYSHNEFKFNLQDLRWILQKITLSQDIFLISSPGNFVKSLVKYCCSLLNLQVEYLTLNRDITESDIKQRREIKTLNNLKSTVFVDQCGTRAAIHGRVLILDGVEKAERNVLPVLNNLLENREMALDDGRFLVNPKRYDALNLETPNPKLIRTSDKFIVIAIGLPTPKYDGYPLDPPFRSRFQARYIGIHPLDTMIKDLSFRFPNVNPDYIKSIGSVVLAMRDTKSDQGASIPEFPSFLDRFIAILNSTGLSPGNCLELLYPHPYVYNADDQMNSVIQAVFSKFGIKTDFRGINLPFTYKSISSMNSFQKRITFTNNLTLTLPAGQLPSADTPFFVETSYHKYLLTLMFLAHSSSDFILLGPKGSGKSILTKHFATSLGYRTEYIPLYKDLTSRDLLQRRATDEMGNSIWIDSGLIQAALNGWLAVLDPIDVLTNDTITSLHRLVMEREVDLPDGKKLVSQKVFNMMMERYEWNDDEMVRQGIFKIHDGFRIIGLGRLGNWVKPEVNSLFSFVSVRPMTVDEEGLVMKELFAGLDLSLIEKLSNLTNSMRMEKDEDLRDLAINFSTRQLLRIGRRLSVFPKDNLYRIITKISLYAFLPLLAKDALNAYLKRKGISRVADDNADLAVKVYCKNGAEFLQIGDVEAPVRTDTDPALIPKVLFYQNQKQTVILQDILKDYILGEHILLIGNQGVGKNKIVDYFLEMMKLPREYIQLHRDTTVYGLTSSPAIVDGRLVYEDSPLVQAVKFGRVLVIDEADKAPTHVTAVIKSLVEDGEMALADGRRLVIDGTGGIRNTDIVIHPQFRMIVLANRPGYPFLGNDFYREIGDVFATHCVENPDPDSELDLLSRYAPSVSKELLQKLIASFNDLRVLVDQGLINYPYSTRELVNVARHLDKYPGDGIARALQNVFAFDVDEDIQNIIIETMNKNGIPTASESRFLVDLGKVSHLSLPVLIESWQKAETPSKIVGIPRDFNVRGTWPFDIPPTWTVINQVNGRASKFSEWLYTFNPFTSGEPCDIILGPGNELYALTTSPVNFYLISPDRRKCKVIPLYEFIPASRVSKLCLFCLGISKVGIYNSQEHAFLRLDLIKREISTIMVGGLDPVNDSFMFFNGEFALVYQTGVGVIILLELTSGKQFAYKTNLSIGSISRFQDMILIQENVLAGGSKHAAIFTKNNSGIWELSLFHIVCSDQYKVRQPTMIHSLEKVQFSEFIHISPPDCHGALVEALSTNTWKVKGWPRDSRDSSQNHFVNFHNSHGILPKSERFVNVIPAKDLGMSHGWLEVVDPKQEIILKIAIPLHYPIEAFVSGDPVPGRKNSFSKDIEPALKILELDIDLLLLMTLSGDCQIYQIDHEQVTRDMQKWKELTGALDSGNLKIIYNGIDRDSNDSNPLIGENAGAGSGAGSGEGNGSGLGQQNADGEGGSGSGSGGPGMGTSVEDRNSGTLDDSFTLRSAGEVSKDITDAQKDLHKSFISEKLKRLNMTQKDYDTYSSYKKNIVYEIRELRAILETVEAKNKERVWLRNHSDGEIDDTKLVAGLAGEKAIYKIRGENVDSSFQKNPKRLYIVFDLSASMMRFNGHDQRMDRSLEAALMLMEAFKGFEHKFNYRFFGHSGDSADIKLMDEHPKNEKQMFEILSKMQAHAAYTMSGDNTNLSITTAIKNITKEEADDYFVLVLSDANLHQYNISPEVLASSLQTDSRVNAFIIFIGGISQQAERLAEGMSGKAFNCFDKKDLPKIIKSIFLKAMIK